MRKRVGYRYGRLWNEGGMEGLIGSLPHYDVVLIGLDLEQGQKDIMIGRDRSG